MCPMVSATFVLWLISFMGYSVQYMLLTNLNIAIIDMIEPENNNSLRYNVSSVSEVPKFQWNEAEEGLILSGVYWILWISHLVGGTFSHRFGPKIVIGYSIMIASIFSMFIPSVAFLGIKALLCLRIIQGFFVGLAFPSIMPVMQYWIPEKNKGKFLTCFLGISFGASITYFISGFVIELFYWNGVFYATGVVGFVWCGMWWYFMYNKPEEHPRILEKEKLRILSKIKTTPKQFFKRPVPWSDILKTTEFYANAIAQFGILWVYFMIIIYGPTYIHLFHDLDSVMTGVISSIPHLLRVLFSMIFATITDKLASKEIMTVTNVRRFSTFISNVIPGISIIVLAYFGENFLVAVLSTNSTVLFTGAAIPGVLAANVDISPHFAGILQGLCGMVAHTSGFLIPLFVGYLTLHEDTIEQWQKIFLICGVISILTGIIFIWLWRSDVKEWDSNVKEKLEEDHVCLYGMEQVVENKTDVENA